MESTNEEPLMPALYEHCHDLYASMSQEAEMMGDHLVYEGFLTKLIRELGYSVPYYTKLTRELKRMDCIQQKRRGGSTTPSQWILLQEPTETLWNEMTSSKTETPGVKLQLQQQINSINTRLIAVEDLIKKLIDAS